MPRKVQLSRIGLIFVILVCVVVLIVPNTAGSQEPAPSPHEQLLEPVASSSYPDAFVAYQLVPRWNGGYLVRWTRENSPSDTAENVFVYDRNGKLVGKTRIWLPDASLIYLDNVVVGPHAEIAAVGRAVDRSGIFADFLARLTLATHQLQVVQTSPFHGRDVAFGPDGTLWVVGYEVGPENRVSDSDYSIVRHFDASNRLEGSYVPHSSLQCTKVEAGSFTVAEPAILTSSDRVGILLAGCNTWLELSTAGEVLGKWTWQKSTSVSSIHTVAFTLSNEVYGSVTSSANWLGHLDKKTGTWQPVNTDLPLSRGARYVSLMGSDGDKLVYRSGDAELRWSKPSR